VAPETPDSEAASDEVDAAIATLGPRMSATSVRLWSALVLAGCIGLLGVAAWLRPDGRGYGTHQQLGLARCGMIITTGLPCPTCGMTTAFSHTVRGQWLRAFWAQPAGFLLALATIAAGFMSVYCIATGRPPPIRMPFLTPVWILIILLVWFVGGWGFKLAIGFASGTLPIDPSAA